MTSKIGGRTVLVVDDNFVVRQILSDLLSELGYQPVVAKNGKEALETIDNKKVDAAFVDFCLPDISGKNLCVQLREKNTFPIVIISGCLKEEVFPSGEEMNIIFLRKPISVDSFSQVLADFFPENAPMIFELVEKITGGSNEVRL